MVVMRQIPELCNHDAIIVYSYSGSMTQFFPPDITPQFTKPQSYSSGLADKGKE